ncbi:dTDP-glucose 4,6-dehydratase [candidate division KSB3 bacterium]|uniref:dTDP-glucose 4,6-dehydratase n=1 Tax=candidate division KSB3 bacterium TaxID=2044937 RepID=A0A2G6EAD0_9BACT|nr:MAG: dTDP-glucose 4,6-dehydratase [candidate division KSB3 bacterium]PIE30804.1 MAG: dTDP-glucose 4,6-dehydratase [candidate division KSB3 bacterium]
MRHILVTGGAGFIGSNFVRYMLRNFPEYTIINVDKLTYAGNLDNLRDIETLANYRFVQGDIADRDLVETLMPEMDAVVHFAAETHVDRSIMDAGSFISTDVYGTFVLLEAARKYPVERFIQISTDEVYGTAMSPEGISRPSLETDALMPLSPYAASKAGADRLAFSYWATHDVPVIITRCSNNYGPYQYPEKLIPLFVTNAIDDTALPLYGDGKNTRDWIFVEEHCKAISLLLHSSAYDGEVFNIGSNRELSVLQISELILNALGKPTSLMHFVSDRPGHVPRHAVDSSKFRRCFDWRSSADFGAKLEETIRWYVEHENWWRPIKEKDARYQAYYAEQYQKREATSREQR